MSLAPGPSKALAGAKIFQDKLEAALDKMRS